MSGLHTPLSNQSISDTLYTSGPQSADLYHSVAPPGGLHVARQLIKPASPDDLNQRVQNAAAGRCAIAPTGAASALLSVSSNYREEAQMTMIMNDTFTEDDIFPDQGNEIINDMSTLKGCTTCNEFFFGEEPLNVHRAGAHHQRKLAKKSGNQNNEAEAMAATAVEEKRKNVSFSIPPTPTPTASAAASSTSSKPLFPLTTDEQAVSLRLDYLNLISQSARAALGAFSEFDQLQIVKEVDLWNRQTPTGREGKPYNLSARIVHVCKLKHDKQQKDKQLASPNS